MENITTAGNEIAYELDNCTRNQMSMKKHGSNNPMYGKVRKPETVRKISNSMKKYHQKKKTFEEAEKQSLKRIEWQKDKYDTYTSMCFVLLKCSDTVALYGNLNILDSYRVYYVTNNTLAYSDFNDEIQAKKEYNDHLTDNEILVAENVRKVIVLGFKRQS